MILIQKKLDFITMDDIADRTNEALGRDCHEPFVNRYKDITKGVILDARPFDVAQYPNLKVISRVGVGVDNIDLEECKERNIKVYTTPCEELIESVAEFTVKQLMDLMSINEMRDILSKKRILIIGSGNIGSKVGSLLGKLGCYVYHYDKVYYLSTFETNEKMLEWLPNADVVSIHVSGTDCVLGKKEIDLLKDNCYVLNMARQGCVDFEYILMSIFGGRNIKYASDVDSYIGFSSQAVEFMNDRVKRSILLTPHIASKTVAARKRMENMALDNLVRGLSE